MKTAGWNAYRMRIRIRIKIREEKRREEKRREEKRREFNHRDTEKKKEVIRVHRGWAFFQ